MKTITRQRKEQLALEARGLCRYSENHGPHIVSGMCYECAIRHRKMRSPHIPDWWPLSIHYSERRYQEMCGYGRLFGELLHDFWTKYNAIPEEVAYAAFRLGNIKSQRLDEFLSLEEYDDSLVPPA